MIDKIKRRVKSFIFEEADSSQINTRGENKMKTKKSAVKKTAGKKRSAKVKANIPSPAVKKIVTSIPARKTLLAGRKETNEVNQMKNNIRAPVRANVNRAPVRAPVRPVNRAPVRPVNRSPARPVSRVPARAGMNMGAAMNKPMSRAGFLKGIGAAGLAGAAALGSRRFGGFGRA